jgi:hypothetical protein
MVADYQRYFNLPVAIMRPTLISSCARDPYPGVLLLSFAPSPSVLSVCLSVFQIPVLGTGFKETDCSHSMAVMFWGRERQYLCTNGVSHLLVKQHRGRVSFCELVGSTAKTLPLCCFSDRWFSPIGEQRYIVGS